MDKGVYTISQGDSRAMTVMDLVANEICAAITIH